MTAIGTSSSVLDDLRFTYAADDEEEVEIHKTEVKANVHLDVNEYHTCTYCYVTFVCDKNGAKFKNPSMCNCQFQAPGETDGIRRLLFWCSGHCMMDDLNGDDLDEANDAMQQCFCSECSEYQLDDIHHQFQAADMVDMEEWKDQQLMEDECSTQEDTSEVVRTNPRGYLRGGDTVPAWENFDKAVWKLKTPLNVRN